MDSPNAVAACQAALTAVEATVATALGRIYNNGFEEKEILLGGPGAVGAQINDIAVVDNSGKVIRGINNIIKLSKHETPSDRSTKKDINPRRIIIVGLPKSGKSALANVLVNKDGNFEEVFPESAGSAIKTKTNQTEVVAIDDINYQITDTVGFDSLKEEDEMKKIFHETLKDNFHQILFVFEGNFDREVLKAYDFFYNILAENYPSTNVPNHITIVKTKFGGFENPMVVENSRVKLTKETAKHCEIMDSVNYFICVDNVPTEGTYADIGKEVRLISHNIL